MREDKNKVNQLLLKANTSTLLCECIEINGGEKKELEVVCGQAVLPTLTPTAIGEKKSGKSISLFQGEALKQYFKRYPAARDHENP